MAKEYTTKDGKKIVGWYRRGGRAIPIVAGQEKKKEGSGTEEKMKRNPAPMEKKKRLSAKEKRLQQSAWTQADIEETAKNRGGKVEEYFTAVPPKGKKKNTKEEPKQGVSKEEAMEIAMNPQKRREKFGKTIDMMREFGNLQMRQSMLQTNDKDAEKFMKGSNMFEDIARQFEGKRPIISLAKEKIGEAQIHADEVTKDLQDSLKGDAGSVDKGLPFRVKSLDSMHRKIREKAWKKNMQPEEYANNVTDALRFTDMVDGKHYVESFNKMKEGLEARGYDMVEVENTIHKKGKEYRGVNTLVTSPKGYTFELQFHTPQSFNVKEENHKDYERERRATTSPAVKKALAQQMKQRANSIETPRGASKIENVKRRPSKGPSEEAIRNMMKRHGIDRITAVKYLKEIYK